MGQFRQCRYTLLVLPYGSPREVLRRKVGATSADQLWSDVLELENEDETSNWFFQFVGWAIVFG